MSDDGSRPEKEPGDAGDEPERPRIVGDPSVDDPDGGDWEFSLSDLEQRAAGSGGDGGGPRAPEPNSASIDRGSPSAENAAFVLLGMLLMIGVLFRLVAAGFGV